MDDQNKNLMLAMVLSTIVLIAWFVLFPPEELQPPAEQPSATQPDGSVALPGVVPPADTGAAATANAPDVTPKQPGVGSVTIDTPSLDGSLSLAGGADRHAFAERLPGFTGTAL